MFPLRDPFFQVLLNVIRARQAAPSYRLRRGFSADSFGGSLAALHGREWACPCGMEDLVSEEAPLTDLKATTATPPPLSIIRADEARGSGAGGAEALLKLAQELARSLDPLQSARIAATGLADLTGTPVAAAYLAEPDGALALAASAGRSSETLDDSVPNLVRRAAD